MLAGTAEQVIRDEMRRSFAEEQSEMLGMDFDEVLLLVIELHEAGAIRLVEDGDRVWWEPVPGVTPDNLEDLFPNG